MIGSGSGALIVGAGGTSGTLGSGNITNNAALVYHRSDTFAVSNVIGGSGTLTKTGNGTMTLSAASTYSGNTTVEAGRLTVTGSITNSAVTVQSNAVLAGAGAVGATTVLAGSTIAPGNSPGTLTINGDLTWNGGGVYEWEIFNLDGPAGTSWDLIEVTGQLLFANISSTNRFSIDIFSLSGLPATAGPLPGWNPLASTNWTILSAAGGISGFDPNNFTLNLANFTNNNSLSGGLFSLATEGNNLKLFFAAGENPGPQPIPEPGTWLSALLLAITGIFLRGRRRRPGKFSRRAPEALITTVETKV